MRNPIDDVAATPIPTPEPRLSVLVVGETEPGFERAIAATVEAAAWSLRDVEHEILVLARDPGDAAAVRIGGATRVRVFEDSPFTPLPSCWESLRLRARGRELLVLAPGTIVTPEAVARLRAVDDTSNVRRPRVVAPDGEVLGPGDAPGACLWMRAEAWQTGELEAATFVTPHLWDDFAMRALVDGELRDVPDAWVTSGGWFDHTNGGNGAAERAFDSHLLQRGIEAPVGATLVVCLGDNRANLCTTGTIAALGQLEPQREIHVVTRPDHAWMFQRHPAITAVHVTPGDVGDAAHEDACVAAVIDACAFDRLLVLTGLGRDVGCSSAEALWNIAAVTGVTAPRPAELFVDPRAVDRCREATPSLLWTPSDHEARVHQIEPALPRATTRARRTYDEAPRSIDPFLTAWSDFDPARRELCHQAAADSCRRRADELSARAHETAVQASVKARYPQPVGG